LRLSDLFFRKQTHLAIAAVFRAITFF